MSSHISNSGILKLVAHLCTVMVRDNSHDDIIIIFLYTASGKPDIYLAVEACKLTVYYNISLVTGYSDAKDEEAK